jgi:phosphate/sulfate permease
MVDRHLIVFGLAVGLAYLYAFVGGFTDAANAIATSVGTRVLSPRAAVALAGVFNLCGGLTGTAVAPAATFSALIAGPANNRTGPSAKATPIIDTSHVLITSPLADPPLA